MKYHLEVAPSVIKETHKIYRYREREHKGSGDRFIAALQDCYALIRSNPYGFQIRKDPFRHTQLHRLKYRIVYQVEGSIVSIVQVRHTSRKVSKRYGP